jgi:hypothetical protein
MVLIEHCVIKHHIACARFNDLTGDVLPHQPRGELLSSQIPIDLVVRKPLTMVGKVSQRIVDLADQQILAIVQASKSVFHLLTLATQTQF